MTKLRKQPELNLVKAERPLQAPPTALKWSKSGDLSAHDMLSLLHHLATHDPSVTNTCNL